MKRHVHLRPNQAPHAQYPALDLRHRAVGWREVRLQQARERAVAVDPPEPGRYAEGVMLIRRAPFEREAAAPQRRIDFSDSRLVMRGASTMPPSERCRTWPLAFATKPSRVKSSSVREC